MGPLAAKRQAISPAGVTAMTFHALEPTYTIPSRPSTGEENAQLSSGTAHLSCPPRTA